MSTSRSESQERRARAARRQDRRDGAAPRLSYEALVEVGADEAGGFEAESVDVSLDGMRMRTAYLPEIGETLVCRFDGPGGEIVAEAEVIWCRSEARGGEFGMRFVGLDAHALTLLQDLCAPEGGEEATDQPSEPSGAQPGARVRLHIEGLGSPMRARVRDAAHGEVLIGSNLEFLRVGRDVELEDIDKGARRVAMIEHVGVEIDRETNVPQLVVALSFEGPARAEAEESTTAPYRVQPLDAGPASARAAFVPEGPTESTPEPTVIDSRRTPSPAPAMATGRSPHPGRVAQMPPPSVHASDPPASGRSLDDDHGDEDDSLEPAGMPIGAAQRVGALARSLGPKLASAGAGARGAIGKVISSMRTRHAARRMEKAKSRAPKRTTAPPPSGALRSDGRRLVRDQPRTEAPPPAPETEAVETTPAPEPSSRKRTAVTAAVAALAVVAIYFGSTHLRGKLGTDAEAPSPAAAAAPANDPAAAIPGAPGQEGIATAAVPLFGATPLSTTEPVPAPPMPSADGEEGDAPGGDTADSGTDSAAASAGSLEKEWGVGDVTSPIVLALKMDGAIDGITGAETATGFTVTIPGRKSVSAADGLSRKDKRIESVNVVNYPDRAEVTLHFKKDVPAFVVRAKGKRLLIEIASAKKASGDKPDAKKPSGKKGAKKK